MISKPNILFIFPDQQRYDCIGYSRDYPVKTPNIDRIATKGMWFTNAYTPIPLCSPARQALLNGKRSENLGVLFNYNNTVGVALEPSEYAWPRDLKEQGYRTGYVGKWHVNPNYNPTEYGFDDYLGEDEYYTFQKKMYPDIRLSNLWSGEKNDIPLKDSRTHWIAKQAIKLIDKYNKENLPWHIRLDFFEPHLPCQPSEPFSAMYSSTEIPVWRSFSERFTNKPYIQKQQLVNWGVENYTWKDWAPTVALYYCIISQVDNAIGEVLDKIDDLGIADNTVIIYSTDHGDMCGDHRMVDKHYVMYDDVVRVPLIICWPGVIKEGKVCKNFVYNCLDLPPTILEIAGIRPKDFFHGKSLLPLLKGEDIHNWRTEVVATYNGQQFGLYTQRMIRNNKWKYIWNATDIDELYNLEDDSDELVNLIYDNNCMEIMIEMRKKLYKELAKFGDEYVKCWSMKNQLLKNKKL